MGSIREAIRNVVGDTRGLNTFVAEVTAVREADRTCDVRPVDGAELYGVRLGAEVGQEQGVYCVPAVGSWVLVTTLGNETGFVSLCAEVEKWVVVAGDSRYLLEAGKVELRASGNGPVQSLPEGEKLGTELARVFLLLDTQLKALGQPGIAVPFNRTNWLNQKIKHN